jgi:hypothetical protein
VTGSTVEGIQMTEMVNGEGQDSSNFAPVTTTSTPQEALAESSTERTFKQSEVNDLIGRAKSEALERYKRESSIASHQPQQQQHYQPQHRSDEDIRRLAAEETQRLRDEWSQESQRNAEVQSAQRMAQEFFTKLEAGKSNLQDFDKVMGEVDLQSIPYHVQLANMVDNTAEVMYELASNPSKIGALQNLIDIDLRAGRQPRLALQEMKRLSESIKTNQKASKYHSPNEPLSQMKPSSAGTGNMGVRTASDYRRDPKYRV